MALDLSYDIHELTFLSKGRNFFFDVRDKKVADSVALNIAEGSTGQSNPEQRKFLGYAQRSAIEVVSCLYIAKKRNLIPEKQFNFHYNGLDKLVAMIQKFRNTIT